MFLASLMILEGSGSALPSGLQFFQPGWWLTHVMAVILVFGYGYRRGRQAERKKRSRAESEPRPTGKPDPRS